MKNLIKAYRSFMSRKPLRIWLIAIFMLIIYIPIVLNIVYIHNQTIEVVRREKIESIQNKLSKVSESINFVTNDIQQKSNNLVTHLGLRKSIQDFEKLDEERQQNVRRFILGRIDEVVEKSGGYINEAFVLTEAGELIKSEGSKLLGDYGFVASSFILDARSKDSDILWQVVSSEELYENIEKEKELVLIEKIYAVDEQRVVGVLIAIIGKDKFYTLYDDMVSHFLGGTEIFDNRLKPLSLGTDEYLYATDEAHNRVAKSLFQEQGYIQIESAKYVVENMYLDIPAWRLASWVPEEQLVVSIQKELRRSLVLVLLVSAIVAIIIAFEITVVSNVVAEKENTRFKLSMSEEINEKLNIYKHDFANHVQIVRGMIELGHTKRAIKYLKNVGYEGLEIKERTDTGVPEIEAILATAYANAKQQGIKVEIITSRMQVKEDVQIYDLLKIINNLIKNAIESLKNSKENNKKLTISAEFVLDEYVFIISNNAPLINEKEKAKIFTKGYTTNQRGRGLGLYIVKKLLDVNEGTINLTVDENGNHFEVKYPG
ncbi:MAG: sensor histidine kinase [Alkaliphilus sp.]